MSKKTPSWFNVPDYDWQKKQAIVIGAGIAGCQMSWHLSQAGWDITLIDRNKKIANEASGNPAGVISPKMTSRPSLGEDFYTHSFQYTLDQISQLKKQGLEWHGCGLLQLSHYQREEKRWQQLKERDFKEDFLQLLDEEETSKVANIPLPYKSSYFPQSGWIDPTHFCNVLSGDKHCKILLETKAIHLEKQENLWHVLDENDDLIAQAEVVIITNGKDLTQFKQTKNLPTMPVAGQTTLGTASEYSSKLKTVIGHEGYLTPADTKSDQHTFGATFDRNNDKPKITQQADKDNLAQLTQYLPEFAESLINTESAHAAVRLTTPDRFPYTGAIPDWDFYRKHYDDLHHGKKWKEYPKAEYQKGLFVLGGFGSRGLTTSGYCAKLLSNIITNQPFSNEEKPILQNLHLARYLIKALKKGLKVGG
ncbi:FAD-dependent 5-carboxymethylaminomethyl-2-thiouridine(34) oxidoreductase MnmC [uncultured Cocleimonas sp.]|uniref:FAD-dependent 5-carboxymethylaminomethyl-2-thiouridine(34) oxidoreductase MnmC n=1 Tax=uncultured Cocleimonas sp. TaxID=1051587 RepID=UPI00263896DD|nr:FAD-dependent 5-carboxymethylaminomethyl-2-thiouridine(34) oxidoreductase MnmC [uncultured Cocleimonas sp.]